MPALNSRRSRARTLNLSHGTRNRCRDLRQTEYWTCEIRMVHETCCLRLVTFAECSEQRKLPLEVSSGAVPHMMGEVRELPTREHMLFLDTVLLVPCSLQRFMMSERMVRPSISSVLVRPHSIMLGTPESTPLKACIKTSLVNADVAPFE